MKIDFKIIGVFILVFGVVTWVAYSMGTRQGQPPPVADKTTPPSVEKHPATAQVDRGLKFTHFRVGNRNVKAILADGKEMWVGTSGGVIRYNTETDKHRIYDVKNSKLLSNGIFHLSKLDGQIAIGTYGGGLSLFDPGTEKWETYNIPDGLADAFVYDVLKVANGDIWIATWSGANRIRGGTLRERAKWELYTVENTQGGLPNDWVYALAEGKDGEIWMATEGGLARFKDDKWQNWGHKDGLGAALEKVEADITFNNDPARVSSHHARQKVEQGLEKVNIAYNPNYIVALLVDKDGNVWCGTWGGGLAKFDGKTWRNFTVADGLPANHVFMLNADPQDRLWIGTSNGIARFDGDSFIKYDVKDGLFSNNVFSMANDAQGVYWIGSFGGVTRMQGL